ncbi:MAG TPA: peptidylprolyl isomerase [Symbiobacteriaceae bacterium]
MATTNRNSTTIIAVITTLVVAGAGGFMIGQRLGAKGATLEGQVVATVNGTEITKADVYERMVPIIGKSVVQDLIDEILVDQAAREAGVTVTPQEVDEAVARIQKQVGGEAQFNQLLATYGYTMDSFRAYQEFRLKASKILAPQITVTDDEVRQYFEENIAAYDQRQVHARHILVSDEETAREVKAQLDQGADFATLAKEKSIDTATKDKGGDLGTFGRGRMVSAFEDVVFNLGVNEISEPFQTSYGWHVAQVLEITGEPPNFEAVKETVKQDLINEKVGEQLSSWLAELRAKAKITNTLDQMAAG